MSDQETELEAPSNPETGRAEEHQLPPDFIFVLCAALAGGLPAGIFTTLISEPGRSGSPIYGLLLPWGFCRFLGAGGRMAGAQLTGFAAVGVVYFCGLVVGPADPRLRILLSRWLPRCPKVVFNCASVAMGPHRPTGLALRIPLPYRVLRLLGCRRS